MGILFTILMGIPFTITMGFLFTIVLGIQLTISTSAGLIPNEVKTPPFPLPRPIASRDRIIMSKSARMQIIVIDKIINEPIALMK